LESQREKNGALGVFRGSLQPIGRAIIAKGFGALPLNLRERAEYLGMSLAKFFTAFALLVMMAIALGSPDDRAGAQLPAPNPLVAPLPAPSGPGQLTVPGQALAAPSLLALPTPTATMTASTRRVFNCSCFGAAKPTSWMGQIIAPSFFAARQAATGTCLSFNERREPPAPVVASSPPPAAVTMPQGFENPNSAGSPGSTLPGQLMTSSAAELAECSQCACD
jgi:hypothetical protein